MSQQIFYFYYTCAFFHPDLFKDLGFEAGIVESELVQMRSQTLTKKEKFYETEVFIQLLLLQSTESESVLMNLDINEQCANGV